MNKKFNKRIKDHFEKASLNNDQLDKLLYMQKNSDQPIANEQKRKKLTFLLPAFSTVLVASLIGFIVFKGFWINPSLTNQIVEEVAYNHHAKMKVEIKTKSIPDIQSFLDHLDFTLIASSRLKGHKWEIIGGRYCSILGTRAAQIKIKNLSNGNIFTLYQVPYSNRMKNDDVKSIKRKIDGIQINLWKESGLLLVLAGSNL